MFPFVLVIALGFFALNVQRLVGYLRLGVAENRLNAPGVRIGNLLTIGIFQRKIFREAIAGAMHATIFWGFMVLTAGTVEIIVQGVVPGFSFAILLPEPIYRLYSASQDGFAVLVLGAIGFAFFRRIVLRPRRLDGGKLEHTDALIILAMIGMLMVTLLLTNAFSYAVDPTSIGSEKVAARMLGGIIAGLRTTGPSLRSWQVAFWWSHALLILIFLNYLPYSKHLHVVTSLINVFFSNTSGPGQKGVMRPMDLEADVQHFGAADIEDLTWKNLLDGYSCTECGRCTAACPANLTGKLLSPRKIIVDTRRRVMEAGPTKSGETMPFFATVNALVHGEGKDGPFGSSKDAVTTESSADRLLDTYITDEELWACTSCRACVQECPVSIDQLDVINQMRRYLVLSESRFPEEIQPAFESLERNGSPWQFNAADRARWSEGMSIPTMAELAAKGERPDVLFWVGCMGAFDDRAKKIAVAFARLMKESNIN